MANVIHKNYLPKGIFDTIFKATNYEVEDSLHNDDNALNRYEFFEILVRIAKVRFLESDQEINISQALSRLLNSHILPMRHKLISWQQWRDEELWCQEVSDVLEVNARGIKKLFDLISKSPYKHSKNRLQGVSRTEPSID